MSNDISIFQYRESFRRTDRNLRFRPNKSAKKNHENSITKLSIDEHELISLYKSMILT